VVARETELRAEGTDGVKAGLAVALLCLVVYGLVPQIASSLIPYRMRDDHEAREFARRFRPYQSRNAQLSCAHLDYELDPPGVWMGRKAWYLCDQMIYSPHLRQDVDREAPGISAKRPLRCVLFNDSPESPLVREWLAEMEQDLALKETRVYHVPVTLMDGKVTVEAWRVFDFVPRVDLPWPAIAGQPAVDRLRC
jgi:hypothetical protein